MLDPSSLHGFEDHTIIIPEIVLEELNNNKQIIVAGDPSQIDNPYLDSQTNGLSYAVKFMRPYHHSAHIALTPDDVVRSGLASWAAANLPQQ